MDLIALAVPFFLLALLVELAADRVRGTAYYRTNDAINSLSAGTLSTTIGYFTRLIPAAIWAFALQRFALIEVDLAWFDLSPRGIALWLLAILAFDFCYYWSHRCGHEISVLWAAHAVHHQSEDYNLSTALRQTSTSFLFNWIFYLPLFLLGMPLEVFLTANAIDLIYQFWVHTQHIKRLGWLDRVFVTPSNHRVHHAQNEIYIDRNYGGILILWDRLFATFQEELEEEPVIFGVRKPLASWNPFWANIQVYDYLWFDAVRTRRWRDKLGVWFRRTGWRPADVEAQYPKRGSDLAAFQRFNPPLGNGMRRYLASQFVAAAFCILWIGTVFAAAGAKAVLLPCALLWITLYSFGVLSESRTWAYRFELLRLFVILPLAMSGMMQLALIDSQVFGPVWTATIAYVLLSAAMLQLAANRPDATAPTVK
jgi:sterol desaturase/sphingolipid hydroxylase (fatty acid hydroxylase superfamily)